MVRLTRMGRHHRLEMPAPGPHRILPGAHPGIPVFHQQHQRCPPRRGHIKDKSTLQRRILRHTVHMLRAGTAHITRRKATA